jgi:tetratricopeptide (TPR) repeat protein
MTRRYQSASKRIPLLGLAVICLASGCHNPRRPTSTPPPSPIAKLPDRKISREEDANVQLAFGRVAEQQGNLDSALAAYMGASKNAPHRAEILQRIAVTHDRMGHFAEASTYYAKALAASPANPEILCDKGYSLYLQKRLGEAEICFRQAIKIKPDLARAQMNLGLVLARQGKTDAALTAFQKAGCGKAIAHQNVAFVLTTEQRLPEARQQYEMALSVDPSSTTIKQRLSELGPLMAKMSQRSSQPLTDNALKPASYVTTSSKQSP